VGAELSALYGRLALQGCVALAATWAVGVGAWGVVDSIGNTTAGLVSQGRYLSGLLLAIGLAYWTTILNIEQKTARFRLLTGLVAIGGLCRLLGVAMGDEVQCQPQVRSSCNLASLPCSASGKMEASAHYSQSFGNSDGGRSVGDCGTFG
jgi:Domain of unknown function (DUF4345)